MKRKNYDPRKTMRTKENRGENSNKERTIRQKIVNRNKEIREKKKI